MIFFWRPQDENGEFGNWFFSPFVENNIQYSCVEQYMMCKKALLFQDIETANKIINEQNPKNMKKLGQEVKNFNQQVWDEHKKSIVKEGCRLKFTQNKNLLDSLLRNKDKTFVEASPYDKIWGIGLKEHETDKNKWKGQNLLGEIITELNQELKKK
jgi:ribA/ribD-fused uncharacterized protein